MMMPEDEAKLKWCPMSRMVNDIAGGFNRWSGDISHPAIRCIGSDCMAWRTGVWGHQRNLKPEDRTPGVGYCGAFGKPTS